MDLITFVLFLLGGGYAYWLFSRRSGPKSKHPFPPGPKGYPIIGAARQVPPVRAHLTFAQWGKKYGDIMYANVYGGHVVILNSSKPAIDLLEKRSAIYSSRTPQIMAEDMLEFVHSTILAPYGDYFRKTRKLLATALNSRAARNYWPTQEKEIHAYLQRLMDTPERFRDHIRITSGAIIIRVAYGHTVTSEDDRYIALVEKSTEYFGRALTGGYLVDYLPFLKYVPLWLWPSDTQKFVKEGRILAKRIKEEPFSIVKNAMADGTAVPSFCSTLLEAKGTITGDIENEEDMIKSTAAILYGAGSDTTVATIGAFILAMTLNPEIQKKAQAELDEVVGTDRLPTFADRERLPYVDAIVKETLRWNVATPLGVPHMCTEDDVYEGYYIPAGATMIFNTWAIMHDAREYKDPHRYWPERFLGENPEKDPHSYAFGFGRRICPGLDVASATVYFSIASTLATFNISKAIDASGKEITPEVNWTPGLIQHADKFPCSIKPRSEKAAELIRHANIDSNWI